MVVDEQTQALTHVGVATVWGLVVMVMIYSVGSISGAHMNPAVTIAFGVFKGFSPKDVVAYCVAQTAAAVAAAAAIHSVLGQNEAMLGATMTTLPASSAVAVELMMTAILMFVVMGVSTGIKEETITAGLAVGATIAMEAFVAGPLTKASMNPARSIGPALVSGAVDQLWIYLVAPLLGALLGGGVYVLLRPLPSGRGGTH
tara:strand:+ start:228605 stop:229207 length:603 start_codon:yes stop_codon:yes gene_type:complete